MGKTGNRAWDAPGLPDLLRLPASLHCSIRQNRFSLPPLLCRAPCTLLSPRLFALPLSSLCLVLGTACKPCQPTPLLARESHEPLPSLLSLTTASSFYLLSSDRLAGSCGHPRESAALSGLLGGKAGGASKRNGGVGSWQETACTSKRLFAKSLPWLSRGDPFGWLASAPFRTGPPPPQNSLQEPLTKQDLSKSPRKLPPPPLALSGGIGIGGVLPLRKHSPSAGEKQRCQVSCLRILPAAGGTTHTPTTSPAPHSHSSPLASAQTPLLPQTHSPTLCGPDIPLPFHTPPPALPPLR